MSRSNQWEAEFQVVYSRNFDAVSRYCLRRLPEQVAQDAVSDVFLTAWRRFDSMPSGEESLPWLYGVARNVVRNAQRSSRRALRLSAKFTSEPRYPEPSPETQIIRNEQDQELIDALESLSSQDQEVLRLRAYEGLTAQQVSIALGCSEEAAKKRISRALVRLRKAAAIDKPVPSGIQPRATNQGGEQ